MSKPNRLVGFSKFDCYNRVRNEGFSDQDIGFEVDEKRNNVFSLDSRIRLARSFQGINLIGYSDETILGYNSFFRVFLTHSALERFQLLFALKNEQEFNALIRGYNPELIGQNYYKYDSNFLLYEFLMPKVNNKLAGKLREVVEGRQYDLFYWSASIRHIFAHGFLTAHANGINPKKIDQFCRELSDFFIDFMDAEFSKRITTFVEEKNL